jgi:uncharacterized protein
MRIYVETEPILHYVEANVPLSGAVAQRIHQPGARTVVSDLTKMECSVIALRRGGSLRLDFDIFLAACDVLPLTAAIFDRAAAIQVALNCTPLTAIHLAAAVVHGCDEFLTRHRKLKRFAGISVHVI